ncbi:DUF4070 domain-containing protein [candidate division KSB1 bacterium]|nr:DUF4070 domain-containing protein [candidate division KSB1 bacterium]
MKILLVYPETPATFWSFKNAIQFVSKKASDIPLGMITVAALLPAEWEKKLVDLNVTSLKDQDLEWADYVFLGGMNIQIESFREVIRRCKARGIKVVAGGPLVTFNPEQFPEVDHFVLNEAENSLPQFIADLQNGRPKPVYRSPEFPDLSRSPQPLWELLDRKKYAQMSVQYSRGCPFDCEFCSITLLNGRKARSKSRQQFLGELTSLYELGWRGNVFIVDDNFIGNKSKLKTDILPALIDWSKKRRYPFHFTTEVSINLADDHELIDQMVKAGFVHTFIGIETPNEQSLQECGKSQNRRRNLVDSVKKLQRRGLTVSGGFIVGFDHDPPSIFEQQIRFIQQSGIVTAMVGLLNAPTGTRLFERLKTENRLLRIMSGDNMDGSMNFVPKMDPRALIQGYKHILRTVYAQKAYYERMVMFLREYHIPKKMPQHISGVEILAFFRSLWKLGVREKGRRYYWKLLLHCLLRYPRKLSTAMTLAIYGFHFRRVVEAL